VLTCRQGSYKKKAAKADRELTARIKHCWDKLAGYYELTDESPYYAAALILHPEYRTTYIMSRWITQWVDTALSAVKALWLQFKVSHEQCPPAASSSETTAEGSAEPELDEYDRIRKELRGLVIQGTAAKDEYDIYCAETPYEIGGMTAVKWWAAEEQRKRFPVLCRFAFLVLSAQAMSDEPERVFSGARRVVSWERMSIGEKGMERSACLKSWLQNSTLDGNC
jgi:hAT family C-terminal dimerisation region